MTQETDRARAFLAKQLNDAGVTPEGYDGPLWDTEAMTAEFDVQGFAAPYVVVKRKSDGVRGTLTFVHSPRVYFDFTEVA